MFFSRALVTVVSGLGLTSCVLVGCSQPESRPEQPAGPPTVTLAQKQVLADQPLELRVSGVAPGSEVTITAQTEGDGPGSKASATFAATADGTVDLEDDAPVRGAYEVASGFGFLWSLHSAADQSQEQVTVRLAVSADGEDLGTVTQVRRLYRAGVTFEELTLKRDGLVGYLLRPPPGAVQKPRAGVVLIGGAEGGAVSWAEAQLLASHGHPTLLLAYFKASRLPRTLERIPLEYFELALRRLAALPSTDNDALVPVGISRGSEAALLTASYLPDLAAGAVTVAGIDVALSTPGAFTPAWTWNGKPVPYADNLRDQWLNPGRAIIDVWRIRGPLLLICGKTDHVWSSCRGAEDIATRLDTRDQPAPEIAAYDDVGHDITALAPGVIYPRSDADEDSLGIARADAWSRLLAHLAALEGDGAAEPAVHRRPARIPDAGPEGG